MKVSRETGVPVIEDCAHAHGALYKGKPVGTIGLAGCWSLQGSKPVSAGEGGVIATNDTEVFERACLVGQVNRIVGMDLATERYAEFQPFGTGMKFRAHPLGIGIARVQLKKLPQLNEGRRRYVEAIEAGLADIPGLRPVPTIPGATRGGFYGFPVHYLAEELGGLPRDAFVEELRAEGIPATGDSGYPLLHNWPLFSKGFDIFTGNRGPLIKDGYQRGDLPATEKMHENILLIPVMTDPVPGATDHVLNIFRRVAERHTT
jgi:dTDP-4-amino-4,6-dideoxygalactose transaminase